MPDNYKVVDVSQNIETEDVDWHDIAAYYGPLGTGCGMANPEYVHKLHREDDE